MGRLKILGGGPAGLAIAFFAHRAGIGFDLYEQSPDLGGLCRTLHYQKHSYDTGAHRLHNRDQLVTQELKVLLKDRLSNVSKPSKVFMGGRFVDFPPTPLSMLRSAGLRQMGRIGFDLFRARHRRDKISSFADFAVHHFGETLARKFLLNYTEKVWGLPAERLSPEVATKRLSGMSLHSLLIEVFHPTRRANHIDGQFLYPIGGYGTIVDSIVDTLPKSSLNVQQLISGFETSEHEIKSLQVNGRDLPVEGRVVSTIPLTLLTELLEDRLPETVLEAASQLLFRNIRLIFLRLSRPSFSDNASIYIPDRELCITRLYEPRNRCRTMAPPGETGIVVEIPCFEGDPLDQLTNRELYSRTVAELEGLGLLDSRWVLDWRHHYLSHAYPVYSLGYAGRVEQIRDALAKFRNLDLSGRNGLFFYSHLHDQLRFGIDYAARLKERVFAC